MQIWKFSLGLQRMQTVAMPAGAQLLSVANQQVTLVIWAMVDPNKADEPRSIEVIGTGQEIPTDMGVDRKFLGTVIMEPYVWHVFERL